MASTEPLPNDAWAAWDTAACGLMQTHTDGLFIRVNRTFCRWVGFTPDELNGKRTLQDLLTMGGRIFHQTHWAPLLQMQGSVAEVKLEIVCKNGSTIPVVINADRSQHGPIMIHDIAAFVARDRDKYERELVTSRRQLQESVQETKRMHEEAKIRATFAEQMVGIVSHDLRNPISAIQMATALLTRESLSAPQEQAAARIARSTRRAGRLISDLLDFTAARIGTGLHVRIAILDLHVMVRDAVDELSLAFGGKEIKHQHDGSGECWGDADRLSQMIGNLVANAMAYGAKDRPVTVSSSIESEVYTLSVHNEGSPIPAQLQATLFKPMVRGVTVGDSRSVGLGLYIVSEIAQAHGGSI